ncbi:RICIN domain-containing protein [Nonomuraea polychroma]|uniref:RICIN domain-containing protein n=1 Tax=Nonomuraea polychroma TaxID=46176 RepID=UPI003D90839A
MSLSRRQLQVSGATAALSVAGISPALAALPWARSDIGVSAYEFDLGQVRLTSGRWLDNQWRFVPNGARRIQNVGTGMVLGVTGMSTADGALVVQWGDTGTPDHRWRLHYGPGAAFRIQCANGGRVLGLAGTSQGAQVVLADDNGANDNLWRFM